jgi:hypothetical protein
MADALIKAKASQLLFPSPVPPLSSILVASNVANFDALATSVLILGMQSSKTTGLGLTISVVIPSINGCTTLRVVFATVA